MSKALHLDAASLTAYIDAAVSAAVSNTGLIAYAENGTGVASAITSSAKVGPQGCTISVPPTDADVWIDFRCLITTTSASIAGQFASYILDQNSAVKFTGYSTVFASEPANSLHTMTGEVRIGPTKTTQSFALAAGTGGGTLTGSIYNGNSVQGLSSWIRAVAR